MLNIVSVKWENMNRQWLFNALSFGQNFLSVLASRQLLKPLDMARR